MKTIIHIGPPKTGTSAIQKWLKDHASYLLSKGVYYPEHQQDSNGISSGNFLSVFSAHNGDYVFNPKKLQDIITKAQAANCSTLLLSSEFFFSRLPALIKAIPDAQFIAYVRNPAQLHESHYNQSVKRHGNTAVIKGLIHYLCTH
ncbi:sulfotransferase [Pseudoalteromonas espejiana]